MEAAYSFNEKGGKLTADVTGKGHSGWVSGGKFVKAGKYGGAIQLDGKDDWVTVFDAEDLDFSEAFTLEAWIKPSRKDTKWQTIIFKEAEGGSAYSLSASSLVGQPATSVYVDDAENILYGRDNGLLEKNVWEHLASTYDGSHQRLYINSQEVSSRAQTGVIEVTNGHLRIGGNNVWGEFFQGCIDEVRIFNRALTQEEIAEDMNSQLPSASTDPTDRDRRKYSN